MESKKLYRSTTDKMISGVCGGLAEYFGVDSTVVRFVWALLTIFGAFIPGILLYIAGALIIPEKPSSVVSSEPASQEKSGE